MNSIIVTGRLTADPILKYTPNNIPVTSFSVAVQRRYQGEEQTVDFIDVEVWRGSAEFVCKYFRKGSAIEVIGELHTSKYKDQQNVQRKHYFIAADKIQFPCNNKRDVENSVPPSHTEPPEQAQEAPTPLPEKSSLQQPDFPNIYENDLDGRTS